MFLYRQIPYKKDARLKKLASALAEHAQEIEFAQQGQQKLFRWVRRRFAAMDKEIDDNAVEHLLFTCGSLMDGLVPEIAKIGAYARGSASPWRISTRWRIRCWTRRCSDDRRGGRREIRQGGGMLAELLRMQEEPIRILAALGKMLRQLYTARLAIDGGKDRVLAEGSVAHEVRLSGAEAAGFGAGRGARLVP